MKKQKQLLLFSLVLSLSLQGCALVKDEIEREPTADELNSDETSSWSLPVAMLTLGAFGDPENQKEEDDLEETSLEDELEEASLLRKTASFLSFGLIHETPDEADDLDVEGEGVDEPSLLHKATFGLVGDSGYSLDENEDENEEILDDRNILEKTISTVTFGKILPAPEEELPNIVGEEPPLNKLQYEVSTYDEVVERFGKPPFQKMFIDGRREARFTIRKKSLMKYLPLIGELAGRDQQSVLFKFDTQGVLEPAEMQEIDFDFLDEE